MADEFTQDNKTLKIEFSAGLKKDDLLLISVVAQEAISKPFSYKVEMLSPDIHKVFDPATLIGSNAAFGVRLNKDHDFHERSGFVRLFQAGGIRNKRFRVYRAEIVPLLAFLRLSTDFRIFQDKTVIRILEIVLEEHGINLVDIRALSSSYPTMEYCVQCHETTFDFISRLMEENGIFYWFDHRKNGSVLVIGDKPEHFDRLDPFDLGDGDDQKDVAIESWEHAFDQRTGAWELGDFSFSRPADPPTAREATRVRIPTANNFQSRYDFPQHIEVSADLKRFALRRMQAEEAQVHAVSGATQVPTASPGLRFNIKHFKDFPEDQGRIFLITSLQFSALEKSYDSGSLGHVLAGALTGLWSTDSAKTVGLGALGDAKGDLSNVLSQKLGSVLKAAASSALSGGLSGLLALVTDPITAFFRNIFEAKSAYNNNFIAIPDDVTFRPPQLTAKPRMSGPHTAIVMGSTGAEKPGSADIHTDQFGRVKVMFIWDRDTDVEAGIANSGWLRVAEGWAGGKWGLQFPPRVGQEVIVDFLDGDPDRPIITGRLYNPGSPQPFDPLGAAPASPPPGPVQAKDAKVQGSQRRSGLKTASTPRPEGGPSRFHMLRFDDNWQKEQIVLRSQGRLDVTSFADHHETVHGNRHMKVGGVDPDTGKGGGSIFFSAGGEYDLCVQGPRYESVGGVCQVSVKGAVAFDFQADWTAIVGTAMKMNAQEVVIEASQKITLKVGGSFIVVDPAGVFIKGMMVQINSGGGPGSTSDADITDCGGAGKADPGEPPNWLQIQPRGRGGPRGHHTAHAHHGLTVTRNADGTTQVAPGLRINSTDPAYIDGVVQQYAIINDTPIGHQAIADIGASGRTTTVQPRPPGTTLLATGSNPSGDPNADANAQNGVGSDSTIAYNPTDWPAPGTHTSAPPDVALFHETQHAAHAAQGIDDNATTRTDGYDTNEEFNTIQKENTYRDQRGPWPGRPADYHRNDHGYAGL